MNQFIHFLYCSSWATNISQKNSESTFEVASRDLSLHWKRQHAEFINAYNAIIEKEGLPLEE
ncbi:MAG: hypothetical protein EBR27_12850 [Betaproteobacteria bacterium]|nr:hypothetical protein [Betaproteobacteria bacterium]